MESIRRCFEDWDTSVLLGAAGGTLGFFLVLGKSWLFWVKVSKQLGREAEPGGGPSKPSRRQCLWESQGETTPCRPAKLQPPLYLFQLSSSPMRPQGSLICGRSRNPTPSASPEPEGEDSSPPVWPPRYPGPEAGEGPSGCSR